MNRFRFYNNLLGWLSFLVAAITYLLTIEPTVSLWDCGEFITTAYKLEVGHPPGAPVYMMLARFFALFASGPEQVALMINALSALASAFTILFYSGQLHDLPGKSWAAKALPVVGILPFWGQV
jgi:hypothetical protein